MTPRGQPLSENGKIIAICLLFPLFWPLLPVVLLCMAGEKIRDTFWAWKYRSRAHTTPDGQVHREGWKYVYAKRWRTLIHVPESIADEVRAALAAAEQERVDLNRMMAAMDEADRRPACATCGRPQRNSCDGKGWLEALGPYSDGSYITSRPCPNAP